MAPEKTEEAKAEEKPAAEAKSEKSDDTWQKKAKAELRRVFRCEKPPPTESLMTLMEEAIPQLGKKANTRSLQATPHARQFILEKGAIEYAKQLEALRVHEKLGYIKEVDPVNEGALYVSPEEKEKATLIARLKTLGVNVPLG